MAFKLPGDGGGYTWISPSSTTNQTSVLHPLSSYAEDPELAIRLWASVMLNLSTEITVGSLLNPKWPPTARPRAIMAAWSLLLTGPSNLEARNVASGIGVRSVVSSVGCGIMVEQATIRIAMEAIRKALQSLFIFIYGNRWDWCSRKPDQLGPDRFPRASSLSRYQHIEVLLIPQNILKPVRSLSPKRK